MSDRPIGVHLRAANLLWKKLKLAGVVEGEDAAVAGLLAAKAAASSDVARDLKRYAELAERIIPRHPAFEWRRDDGEVKAIVSRMPQVRGLLRAALKDSGSAMVAEEREEPEGYYSAYASEQARRTSPSPQSRPQARSPSMTPTSAAPVSPPFSTQRSTRRRQGASTPPSEEAHESRVRAKVAALAGRRAMQRHAKASPPSATTVGRSVLSSPARERVALSDLNATPEGGTPSVGKARPASAATAAAAAGSENVAPSPGGSSQISHFLFSESNQGGRSSDAISGGADPIASSPVRGLKEEGEGILARVSVVSLHQELASMNSKFTK